MAERRFLILWLLFLALIVLLNTTAFAQESKLTEQDKRLIYSRAYEAILWASPALAIIGIAYYAQWKLSDDDFGVGLAPVLGRELGRHRVYGFGPELN